MILHKSEPSRKNQEEVTNYPKYVPEASCSSLFKEQEIEEMA
jgi:hypothetical protein